MNIIIMIIIIFVLIIIIFIFVFVYFITKSKKNVSALSYVNTKYNVPEYELLFLFIDKYNDNKYKNYMNKVLDLNLLMDPVYVIKKINNKYEYEIYFYRYDQHRQSKFKDKDANFLDLKLNNYNETFPTIDQLNEINININNNKLFNDNLKYIEYKNNNNIPFDKSKENEFIIVSYDINENFFNTNKHTYNYYYFKHNDPKYFYYIKEEDPDGNIIETNQYNLFYHLFSLNDKNKFLINKFETADCIIFYAYKPIKNLHALYFENLKFNKFIYFLEYFNYDKDIIIFCKNNYNNNYRFCVSYDMNNNYEVLKTAIFSILQK
jgi:uncharacterized membrane protein